MPPRAGKSYTTTLFTTWLIGKTPEGSVMRNCCTATLYRKFSYDARNVMRTEKYKEIFPDVQLSDDKQNIDGWNTTKAKQVSYFGNGVGGTIIGFGASLVAITDDLFRSFEDVISEVTLEKTHSWYDGTHSSRLEKNCPSIDIGTRWSKKDIIGTKEEQGYYDEVIVISALDEQGNSFCESVKTTAEYHDLRERNAPEIWNAEYMQQPIESTGTLFKKSEIQRFSLKDFTPNNSLAILGYIDTADGGTDRLAMAVAYIFKKQVFITDVVFSPDNIDVTLPQCAGLINRIDVQRIRVEINNQGGGFARGLRDHVPPHKIETITNTTNKLTRVLMEFGFIKSYFHFRDDYERNSEYDKFMVNFFDYTKYQDTARQKSQADDAADCIAGLSRFIQSNFPYLFK